ncbi:MAG TPA: hypothetical protein VMX16_03580 [Terriglobia bacterium]|nr:hypothetical protein [Terriglobia bacterium]
MPPMDFLRIHLIFVDELAEIMVVALPPLLPQGHLHAYPAISGTIKGSEEFEQFLTQLNIDGYLVTSGDALRSPFTITVTIYAASPQQIVETLKSQITRIRDVERRILEGGEIDPSSERLAFPVDLKVCATAVESLKGRNRVQAWFSGTDR